MHILEICNGCLSDVHSASVLHSHADEQYYFRPFSIRSKWHRKKKTLNQLSDMKYYDNKYEIRDL